ncbi:tyrosine-protein phosphatase non-receptor type 2 isoform X2 [Daktulosphaira vitifoliae]|uniref:tyrosine-protein phosphatase non-receptor type 2 isoform X2 n=1 Tax=Daktulosphaira vitifoliae TaxID=58002 RepID=UPI0021AAF72B|nr:tyrosine-protein phosphatase non-receptor type 2 isoform X2 [Daktulosphaira vitifoliae]
MQSDQKIKDRLLDEFKEIESKNMWNTTFRFVETESLKIRKTSDEAKKVPNKILNRYQDVSPYDDTIISLKKGNVSYINANLLQVCDCDRKYILTQGPLENTTSHFWLMVWEQNSKAIIMLNKVIEKKKLKCHQYWPKKKKENYKFIWNDIGLSVEFITKINHGFYIQSILKLNDLESGDFREILHFHYTDWPDFGVPKTPTPFLRFLRDIRRSGALETSYGPTVVHCSAGIGRSGTFCLIDICLVQMKTLDGLKYVHIRSLLVEMRKCRMGLVQAPEQLRFGYQSIIEALDTNWDADNEDELPSLDGVLLANDNGSGNESSDSELSNEAPPLPPPRTESLNKAHENDSDDEESLVSESESDDTESTPPPLPPPRELDLSKNNKCNKLNCTNDDSKLKVDGDAEKTRALAEKLKLMKRKQKEQEYWEKIKRSWLKPLKSLGLGVLALSGGVMIVAYFINYKK